MNKLQIKFSLLLSFLYSQCTFCQNNNGGFQAIPYEIQETAPGMILIEGIISDSPKKYGLSADTIRPFYISALEETNAQYLAYLSEIKKYYSPSAYEKALPDTSVWLKENLPDSLKKYLFKNYLRNYIFQDYPVVGVSPEQILKYAQWKTDRVNEMILIREGLLDFFAAPDSLVLFSTEGYLGGKWQGQLKNKLPSFDDQVPERDVRMEDGIFLPRYRIAVADEWKIAALATGDKDHYYFQTPKPYNHKKFDKKNYFGYLFVTEKGIASNNYPIMATLSEIHLKRVYNVSANNYLVRGMYDNVSEWALDANGSYIAMGGSWKTPGPSYATVYDPLKPDNSKYVCRMDFVLPTKEQNKVSGATGFRLAMDYIGNIDPRIKKRKVKNEN
ncbi:MAG: SUMF1/EgtB/PvdO family nonheme iron enzyme [Bacteroidia bacterium]|nr:SUMF1/EgtB/PvdO family nonheme iron enzyme [Bacteroidia bacterium]